MLTITPYHSRMFRSLSSRIAALGALMVAALAALSALLMIASGQTLESFRLVAHSGEVIETSVQSILDLRDAETGQRGFILTHNPVFAKSFDQQVGNSGKAMDRLVILTSDNPLQNSRARELRGLIGTRVAVLNYPLNLARHGAFDAARDEIASLRGLDLRKSIDQHEQIFLEEERNLRTMRVAAANARLAWGNWLALIGGSFVGLLAMLVCVLIIRGIRRPIQMIRAAMAELGDGGEYARIDGAMGSREFAKLADGYNAMADRLDAAVADQRRSEDQLQIAHRDLLAGSEALRERNEVIELLGGMAHRMQAARSDEELAHVIRIFVPQVLPGIPGVLYAHNNSRNMLVPIASWGDACGPSDGFAPDQCWALRRGQSHFVATPGADIVCEHVSDGGAVYHCEPLLAGGEIIGTLYLRGMVSSEDRFRLNVMAENIASALVNHRLQRGLREQTIRDPLTGLFNRRYMQETLVIEIARAARSGEPLGLVMCDIDHFKRFNDEFGHDGGDLVLQAVAAEMRNHFREGDVICRYGGEEFTVIAPGTTAAALAGRVEIVRQAIADLSLRRNAQTLGPTSMSFGIADWHPSMARDGVGLIRAADAALYQAKREGRNRAVIDLRVAA